MEKILALSFLVLAAASAAPAPDCEDNQCSCILPVVIMPSGGGGGGGLLNNLLQQGLLNGGVINGPLLGGNGGLLGGVLGGNGGLLGNLLNGLLGGRRPTTAVGTPVYRYPNGEIVGNRNGDQIGDVSGILNNALLRGIANGGVINVGDAGEAALAYGARPITTGNTDGLLNNLAPLGALNAGVINA